MSAPNIKCTKKKKIIPLPHPCHRKELYPGECGLAASTQAVVCQNDHPSHTTAHLLPILHTVALATGMSLQPSLTSPHPSSPTSKRRVLWIQTSQVPNANEELTIFYNRQIGEWLRTKKTRTHKQNKQNSEKDLNYTLPVRGARI